MGWFSSKVKVKLIDHITWKVLQTIKVPPDKLPETFAVDTKLYLGNSLWRVVEATPVTRAEFSRTKSLTIRVEEIKSIDPQEIRYTLPTLFDPLAPVGNQPVNGTELRLHEDDWRQVEFVSKELSKEVDEELYKIRIVLDKVLDGGGFDELHIRTRPANPIIHPFPLTKLGELLQVEQPAIGLSYEEADTRIHDGFAFELADEFFADGLAPQGNVTALAIFGVGNENDGQLITDKFLRLADAEELDLIVWCQAARLVLS